MISFVILSFINVSDIDVINILIFSSINTTVMGAIYNKKSSLFTGAEQRMWRSVFIFAILFKVGPFIVIEKKASNLKNRTTSYI